MATFTPGPWESRRNGRELYVVGPADKIGKPTICDIPQHFSQSHKQVVETECNSRLIASAPEMFEVLTELCGTLGLETHSQRAAHAKAQKLIARIEAETR